MQICGIPVEFDHRAIHFAEARGIWPFRKRIVVGPHWYELEAEERIAVLYHEAGHCLSCHMEKRALMFPLFLIVPWVVCRWARNQEIEADWFAAANGFGLQLARIINKVQAPKVFYYPSSAERHRRLQEAIHELDT